MTNLSFEPRNPAELNPGMQIPLSELIDPHQLAVHFTNGEGTICRLDSDIPNGGERLMTPRDKALAIALLEHAMANVRKAEVSK